jgi:hypothetical protein
MSSVLVIGGDRLGNICALLRNMGFTEIIHVTGRKPSDCRLTLPVQTDMILVFTDFINHNLAKHIKALAKQNQLPICFCRRSCSAIVTSLNALSSGLSRPNAARLLVAKHRKADQIPEGPSCQRVCRF